MISGASLNIILEDPEISEKVSEVFSMTSSIIVYRSSPDDKAQTIKFIMRKNPGCFTLAIGDGANDVNMI
jgi:phospholipid-transporting ATPase